MQPPESRHLMVTANRPPLVMARGEGSFLFDEDGARYLDFVQGWAVNALGHAPRVVAEAVARQAATLLTPSPAFHHRPLLTLARRLAEASGLERVFVCSTGAEANEGAIKLARKWGRLHRAGAYEIVTTHGAFHGRTLATMAASGKPGWDALFPPPTPGFTKVPFGDAEAVRAAISERTVALMVEPIQGEGGVIVPPDGYLRALRGLTDEHGILLILDEVQTGIGRTGRLFAFEHEDVRPDVLTLGKGLGAGFPVAALLATERASCFEVGDQGGTYAGHPLACAAANAVLDVVATDAFLAQVRATGARLRASLDGVAARYAMPRSEGRGLLVASPLGRPIGLALVEACRSRGLLVNAPRPDRLRWMPALDVAPEAIDQAIEILDGALSSVA